MDISIVIPVFNEEKNIRKVLQKISQKIKSNHEVIIVYDTPKDPTYKEVISYKKGHKQLIRLVRNNVNDGKGVMNAIKTGFANATGNAVVVVMADLSDDISQIDHMFGLIKKGNDVVCASRFMKGGKKIGGPFIKTFLSKFADISLHYLVGLPTHDATNAYKMYSKDFLDSITVESIGGFEYSLEITLKAYFSGKNITEISTTWRDREAGKSNFKLRKWLPQYIKWYIWALKEKFSVLAAYFAYTLSSLLITSLYLGNQFKNKIPVISGLDLSWQTDAVERLLHGFIAGRDYIFTYGPLFQWFDSLPALLWHVPSYVSVPLSQLFASVVVAMFVLIISSYVAEKRRDKLLLPPILLFLVGISPILSDNSGIRFLVPLVYACLWTPMLLRQRISTMRIIALSLLPSIFGLYVYDLFPQTILIGVLLLGYLVLKSKETISRRIIATTGFIVGLAVFQVLTSFIVSGSILYTKDSLATLSDYYAIMNTVWEVGKSNYLFVSPMVMVVLMIVLYKSSLFSQRLKVVLLVLATTAFTQLRTALIRSDSGHILAALYPSMIVAFIMLYFLMKTKKVYFALLFIFLFTLTPFRDNYYSYLSVKNINAVLHVIRAKENTGFQDAYSFPKDYAIPSSVRQDMFAFIAQHKGDVMVYPFDTYLLNSQQTTFNTYALQLYDYSSSRVEERTVSVLEKRPPMYIILEVDGASAFALDGMPNFTRNPFVAKWMIKNYSILKKVGSVLLLRYDPQKQVQYPSAGQCLGYSLEGNFSNFDGLSLIKPNLSYFVYNGAFRLPVKSGVSSYLVILQNNSVNGLESVFKSGINFSQKTEDEMLERNAKIVSVNFRNQVNFFSNIKIYCLH